MNIAIDGYSNEEVKSMIDEYVKSIIDEYELEITFIDSALHGSRLRGDARPDSDLDYVFEYSGNMKEYAVFNILHENPYYIEDVEVDINPIREQESGTLERYMRKSRLYDLEKTKAIDEDFYRFNFEEYEKKDPRYNAEDPRAEYSKKLRENKIIKVDKKHFLNEDIGLAAGITAGTAGTELYNGGFSYEIVPLSTNLSQRGSEPEAETNNKSYKIFIGDAVKGFCPYDNKKHKGMVKYLYYRNASDENTIPKFVYIQDFADETIIPLTGDSVKLIANDAINAENLFKNPNIQNPYQFRDQKIDQGFINAAIANESYKRRKYKK